MKPDELRAWVVARLYVKEYTTARPVSLDDLQTGLANGDCAAVPEAVAELAQRGWVVRSRGDGVGLVQDHVGASVPWAFSRLSPDRQAAVRAKAPPWLRDALPALPTASPTPTAASEGVALNVPGASSEPDMDFPVTRRELLNALRGHATLADFDAHRNETTRVIARVAANTASATASEVDARAIGDLRSRIGDLAGALGSLKSQVASLHESAGKRSLNDDVTELQQQVRGMVERLDIAYRWSREAALESGFLVKDYFPATFTMLSLLRAPDADQRALLSKGWPTCSRRGAPGTPCGAPAFVAYPAFRPNPEGDAWAFSGFEYSCSPEHDSDVGLILDEPAAARRLADRTKFPMGAKTFHITGAAGEVFVQALGARIEPKEKA